jgi:hypothetical protein
MLSFLPTRTFALLAAAGCVGAIGAQTAQAGVSILVADRTAHKIWRLTDDNNNGTIEPNEVHVWFDGTNAAGTPGIGTLGAVGSRPSDDTIVAGDSVNHVYYWFRDLDQNGDALGVGESKVILTAANAGGAAVNAPSGVAFFPNGDFLICNSGTTSNPDGIYRLTNPNGAGSYDGAGSVINWVTNWPGFGVGNSPYVPFETVVDRHSVGYVRSTGTNNGVYKFADTNGNGHADDTGEFIPYFNSSNQSGITLAAGFALEIDLARPSSFYTLQVATGGVDQLIRLTDLDLNGDANGPGEAVMVYSTAESGFSSNDIISLSNGDVLISDVTSANLRIIRLHDIDGDGLFTGPGERTTFFSAAGTGVLDVRQMVLLHPHCLADFNLSGGVEVQDIFDFLSAWFAGCIGQTSAPCNGQNADFNGGGLSVQDIFDFLNAWFVGCPT